MLAGGQGLAPPPGECDGLGLALNVGVGVGVGVGTGPKSEHTEAGALTAATAADWGSMTVATPTEAAGPP